MRKINKIIIHHSAGPDTKEDEFHKIYKYHKSKKWRDIGYHFVCEHLGKDYKIIVARPLDMAGAHCKGHNRDSIGICFVGNYDVEVVEAYKIDIAIYRLILPLCKIFNLNENDIYPHRAFRRTSCPGRFFPMDYLREIIKEELKRKRI